MKTYYLDQNGTFFHEYKDHLDRRIFRKFDMEEKEWKCIDWEMHQDQITEVTETRALTQLQAFILDNLDRKELHKLIDLLCYNRKAEWNPMEERDDGVLVLGYPKYPEGLFDMFNLLGYDYEYRFTMEDWPDNFLPTDMDFWQIRTALTYLQRADRFCTGTIAGAMDDGTLLKLLLRLDDILNAHQGRRQHW